MARVSDGSSMFPFQLLYKAPRTSTGAISHRIDSKQYWYAILRSFTRFSALISHQTCVCRADGVYMGFPFIAAYGAVTNNQTLLQIAYDNCRLYRDALLQDGPTGKLWAHIYSDDNKTFVDPGLWATGEGISRGGDWKIFRLN